MSEKIQILPSDQFLAAIVHGSEDAIISKDLNGTITSWNEGAEHIFGYSEDEIVGRPIMTLIPVELRKEEENIIARLRRGERIEHFETTRVTKNGNYIEVSLTISPIKDVDGRVIGASKIARDISERKRIENALIEAQKQLEAHSVHLEQQVQERTLMLKKTITELEAFSYSLSHDLRAPLRAIQGFLAIVLEDYGKKLDSTGIGLLQRVISSSQRMDRMILDLLAFTQISHAPMILEPVDVEKLIREIIRERTELQPPNAEITIDIPLLAVTGNEASLTQCITNLLDNAVKFVASKVKPHVHIYSEAEGNMVRLWFVDNGIGIDSQAQQHLFQMFQRVHGCDYPGTGIGLAIVRKATERMGGKAGIESEPGKGSRFWLQLPGKAK